MKPFLRIAGPLLSTLRKVHGQAMMVRSACFVVGQGPELKEFDVHWHLDMETHEIEPHMTFTCLAPLKSLPTSVGGLQFQPWARHRIRDVAKATQTHKYQLGTFATFDQKLLHRTEPFCYERNDAEADVCKAFEDSGNIRVLVSLSIVSEEERVQDILNSQKGYLPAGALVR